LPVPASIDKPGQPEPRALLAAKLRHHDDLADRFVAHLLAGHEGAIDAIVFYGSLLAARSARPTSYHDFYVIVDSLEQYHRRMRDRIVGRVLPPSVYYRVFEDGLRCKYCVLTRAQFETEMTAAARDLHNIGRFSKRVGLVYARDAAAEARIVLGCLSAARTLLPHALALLPSEFTLDEFIRTLLRLSYLGEQRVAEDAKVEALFAAERDHYRAFYGALLREHGLAPDGERYQQPLPDPAARAATEAFLARSRRRGKLRWPKYMVTVDGWLDIIIEKVERHHGVKIELTERERRYPLLFAWPKYFALKRRGVVK
jgi:hypothetical protein